MKFAAAFYFDARGYRDGQREGRKREKGRRQHQTVKGYRKTILFSVISLSLERDNFFSQVFPPQLCVAMYRMRGCVEIKYSRRELRPPLGLIVARNSFDFIFLLICHGNRKYA